MQAISLLSHSPLFGVGLTLACYQVGQWLHQKTQHHPLANPVLIAIICIILSLKLGHVSYENYWQSAQLFSFFNGLVVVALAIPLHHHRKEISQHALKIALITTMGAIICYLSGVVLAKLLSLNELIQHSVAARAVTTPLAILITELIGGNAAIITLFALLNGILSSMLVFPLLKVIKVDDEMVMGLTAGIAASAIGTALCFAKNYRLGSFASLGMILNGLISSSFIPLIYHCLK